MARRKRKPVKKRKQVNDLVDYVCVDLKMLKMSDKKYLDLVRRKGIFRRI